VLRPRALIGDFKNYGIFMSFLNARGRQAFKVEILLDGWRATVSNISETSDDPASVLRSV
jgi:hypothetical protein